jgi:hypothetical protein
MKEGTLASDARAPEMTSRFAHVLPSMFGPDHRAAIKVRLWPGATVAVHGHRRG